MLKILTCYLAKVLKTKSPKSLQKIRSTYIQMCGEMSLSLSHKNKKKNKKHVLVQGFAS